MTTSPKFNKNDFIAHNAKNTAQEWFLLVHAMNETGNSAYKELAAIDGMQEYFAEMKVAANEQYKLAEERELVAKNERIAANAVKAQKRTASVISQRGVRDENDLCFKCDGIGAIPGYRHIEDGVCFKCNGTGLSAKGKKFAQSK